MGPRVLTGSSALNSQGTNANEINKTSKRTNKKPTNHPGNWLWPITWNTTAIDSQHPDPPTGPGTSLHACWKLRTKNRAPTLCSAVRSSTSEKQGEYSSCEVPWLWQMSAEMGESLYQPEGGCHLSPEARLQEGRITTDGLQRRAWTPTTPHPTCTGQGSTVPSWKKEGKHNHPPL